MQDMKLLNIGKVCAMLMLDKDSVKSLLRKFQAMLPEMIEEIKTAVESKDTELVKRLGHKLKGTAGNFRIDELQEISGEINKLKSCDEEAHSLILRLEDCVQRLIAEIRESC